MAHTIETNLTGAAGAAIKPLRAFGKVRRFALKFLHLLVIWQERNEQRHTLCELRDSMLKDIGISAGDAYKEMRKPFWLP